MNEITNSLATAATAGGTAPAAGTLVHLSPVDMAVIAIYFMMVLGIGWYLKRFAKTGEGFFMAGREMTAWIAGLSFLAANLGSLELMGWAAATYQYGILATHWYWIGAIPAMLFLGLVMMPFYYICKTHSVPGYLHLRYNNATRVLSGVTFAFMTVLTSGINMYAMALVMKVVLGWDINFSIWVSSITVAIYVVLGGLLSAIFNEVLQFMLIWLGALLIPILGLIQAGGWDGMIAKIHQNFPGQDYTHLWAGLGHFSTNPMGINWVGIVVGLGLVISPGYWMTNFLVVQRVLTAKDLRSAQSAPIIGASFKMMIPIIVILPGLLGLALLHPHLLPEQEALKTGGNSYNEVLPLLMGRYLGPGLLGLGITALVAGFMSGMAGNVSAFATVWTYDIYRPLIRKQASDEHYVRVGRWWTFLGVLISIGTAYLVMQFEQHHGLRAGLVQLVRRPDVGDGVAGHVLETNDGTRRILGAAARHVDQHWPLGLGEDCAFGAGHCGPVARRQAPGSRHVSGAVVVHRDRDRDGVGQFGDQAQTGKRTRRFGARLHGHSRRTWHSRGSRSRSSGEPWCSSSLSSLT